MRVYLKLKKKIDVEMDESTVLGGGLPEKNKDYLLVIQVALLSKEITQVEAEDDDEEVYYYLETVGAPTLVPQDHVLTEIIANALVVSPEPTPLLDNLQSLS